MYDSASSRRAIASIQGPWDQEIVGLVSPNLDFIDICSVASQRWPNAVVGLTLDRSLVFVRDLLAREIPQTLRLGELRGTPYSIPSGHGQLFILTSKELLAFPDLLAGYLNGEAVDRPFRYRYTPNQAVDASIAYGRHLMVVMDEEVRVFELPRLVQPTDEVTRWNGQGEYPEWSEGEQLPTMDQPNWSSLLSV
jgi:hypothetical protein